MPSKIDIESVKQRWEAKYNRSLSDDELIERAKISLSALRRMTSGTMYPQDGFKILALCHALECDPDDIIMR